MLPGGCTVGCGLAVCIGSLQHAAVPWPIVHAAATHAHAHVDAHVAAALLDDVEAGG